ncbi:MAG: hypothetical protein L3K06_03280 [Thermoplasmata archaeon]|nr:hypothetical protein [Thermoplasmata archaeon]MCI4354368.1 hypothetical protein [Thermoplasmata archaeon]
MARGDWARFFPLPFVGVAVLLVLLILLTPNLLLGGGPAAGSLATQAELTVDHPSDGNVTHFYINGLGTVRYEEIRAMVCTNVSWPAPATLANLSWENATWGHEVLAAEFTSTANPILVNVTATYVDAAGAAVEFYGLFEFYVGNGALEARALAAGLSDLPSTPLSSLPVTILLASTTPGAVP